MNDPFIFQATILIFGSIRWFASQAFCSAVSCHRTNGSITKEEWAPLARLVLDGAYEATLWAAAIEHSLGKGSGKVFLTMLGGGAFGNDPEWIADSISRAIKAIRSEGLYLDVNIVHFRHVSSSMKGLIDNRLSS